MGKWDNMEQNTLQALLTGLQGGMSGQDAAAMFGSVLQSQQARQQQNRELIMSLMGQFGNMAGETGGPEASLAYLNAIQQSGILGPQQIARLADYNAALYPGDNQSPLYGLVGDPSRMQAQGLDASTAITGIPDSELARWGQGVSNTAIYNAIVEEITAGRSDPSDIFEEIAKDPVMGYWASQNQQAALRAIQKTLGANPDAGPGFFGKVSGTLGDTLVPWMALSGASRGAQWGAARWAGSEGLLGTVGAALSKVPNIPGPISTVKGLPGLIANLAARLGIGGAGAGATVAAEAAPAAAEGLGGLISGASAAQIPGQLAFDFGAAARTAGTAAKIAEGAGAVAEGAGVASRLAPLAAESAPWIARALPSVATKIPYVGWGLAALLAGKYVYDHVDDWLTPSISGY